MSSKSHPKHPFLPTESSTSARHSFNSHRFAAESSMMNTHAQTLLKAGTIDSAMATQLSQPWHRTGEVRVQYSKDYLQMHPDYTGENAHEMPTLNWAMRKQRERDRKAKEWLERYFSEGADGREVDEERKEEHKDKNAVEEQQEEWETETATATSSANAPSSPGIRRTHNPPTSSPIRLSSPPPSSPPQHRPQNQSPNAKPNNTSHSSRSDSSQPTPKRKSSSKSNSKSPPPLTPLPNHPTYASHNYFALAALCRARKLPGAGSAGVLRNRLIQDDMNVAAGKERETKRGTGGRKSYVHGVPEEDGSSGEDGKDGGKQGGSGTDSEVQEKKVGSEEAFEDFTWKKGGKRKRDDDEGDGKDGEAKKVKLTE
ncbi:hypothetical protein HBI56_079390 [Parastagonospora nodorum]|nr:hypothetical protein HBH53_057010 [Parastagonospora nodorum]KAH4986020.1 hypothetical protein HBI76_115820 [Parastagonospora nodorum]KAH5103230.1 hypothetical protein HBH72_076830 [Parastagonospora nodorum]KAH5158900.1 hypothetical protein HBI73_055100 [Parastagonospora nodorum]KAH5194046.1 hypothetical protein HBH68_139000 [Parastagonospora nodorum]